MRHAIALLVTSALLSACGDGTPISYSQPVGISLNVQSKDVVAGAVSASKNVNTENGNPYGAFTQAAAQRLGGRDPSHIVVTGLTLELLASSTGVTALDQVFTGTVAVGFQPSSSAALYPVGQIANPAGAGPLQLSVAFDSSQLPAADRAAIAQGQFKVVLAGTATGAFAAASDTANLKATFTFVAFQ